jgi:hypothetical protein
LGERSRGEAGELAECGAANFPGFGWHPARGEFFDDGFGFGDSSGADALGAAGGDWCGRIAGKRTLCCGKFFELGGGYEIDLAAGFEVAPVGGDRLAKCGFVGGAGFEAKGEGVAT